MTAPQIKPTDWEEGCIAEMGETDFFPLEVFYTGEGGG